MNPMRLRQSLWLALTTLLLPLATWASDAPPDVSEEGLHRVTDSKWGLVYVDPEADWTPYTQVIVLEPYVAFKKNWLRDQNRSRTTRVTASDMEKIKTRLAGEFDAIFREALEANDGFPVVDTASDNTLILRPAIINLDVYAPDTLRSGRSTTYAQSAGEMTIYMEIFDSVTGDMMAKGLDRQADHATAFMTWQNAASNKQAARRVLTSWAQSLRGALDEIHQEKE